ncbi:peptidase inhibitor family I36 protein [Streptomyces globisporus]|uniref:peptidase inhibitor family I36 protein n=1 Tax=Streptomyces globisporus TaxID=1908 RepID=UPI0004C9CBF5|nr:peptidase inhibitor family I36 protein [Streptomyces globisporus]
MSTTHSKSGLRRKVAVLAGATALLVGGGIATATSASAGPSCPSGYHCLFEGSIGSSVHNYFNSDRNFTDDVFSSGHGVNDNSWSASNSSTGGYESHYYYDSDYQGGLVFCVNPGSYVTHDRLTDDFVDGNHNGQRDEASSLELTGTTSVSCF